MVALLVSYLVTMYIVMVYEKDMTNMIWLGILLIIGSLVVISIGKARVL